MPPKRKKGVATPINHTIIDATRRSKRQADKKKKHIESPPMEAANVSKKNPKQNRRQKRRWILHLRRNWTHHLQQMLQPTSPIKM